MVGQTLLQSIEALESESFTTSAYDATFDIYLDPVDGIVYSYLNTHSVPATAYEGTDRLLMMLNCNAIGETVKDSLMAIADKLDTVMDGYHGTEFDDCKNKNVANWDSESLEYLEDLTQSISGVGYYWEPSEWFEPVVSELKEEWESGKAAVEIIDSQDLGTLNSDGCCDRDEAIKWLTSMIEGWANDE
jgi:hypothetical protein